MNTLPDKLSELIRVAVWDLIKTEQMPYLYRINMYAWHDYSDLDNKCHVCLAGAVMAQTIGVPHATMLPDDVIMLNRDDDDEDKLFALDEIRKGSVGAALSYMMMDSPFDDLIRPVTEYERDSGQFKQDLLKIADELGEMGL